jgi:hypothetical protein
MLRSYENVNDIRKLVAAFENATIGRDEWKHAEHMVVALWYLEEHDLATATNMMRAGILNLLENGFGIDLAKEMPYHETVTVFWMRTVYGYRLLHPDETLIEKANGLIESFDKDHPFAFYSRDRLMSDEARAAYIEPDIAAYKFPKQLTHSE